MHGCTALVSVELPGNVEEIDSGAFSDCSSLEEMHFLEGIKKIDGGIWEDLPNLKAVYIPESVTEIWGWRYVEGKVFTVYGKKGTAAETFAKENNLIFIDISETSQTPDQSGDQK